MEMRHIIPAENGYCLFVYDQQTEKWLCANIIAWEIKESAIPIVNIPIPTWNVYLIRTPQNDYITHTGELLERSIIPEWVRQAFADIAGVAIWEIPSPPLPPLIPIL
jgi:hypothetical protein